MVQAANRCGTMNTVMLKVKHRIIIIFWLYRIFLCILMVLNIPISIAPERTPTRTTKCKTRANGERTRARTRSKQRKRAIMNQWRFIEKESLFNAVQWVCASERRAAESANGRASLVSARGVNILMNLTNRWESDALHGHGTLISGRIERWIDKVTTYWTS